MGLVQSVFQFSNAQLAEAAGVTLGSELDVDVADMDDVDAGRAAPVADMNTTQVFTHWWDPDTAAIALAKALELTEAEIDALGPEEQYQAVVRAWAHFHSIFDYFNVRVRSWELYRKVMTWAFGSTSHGRISGNDPRAGDFHRRIYHLVGTHSGTNPDHGTRWPDTITLGTRGQGGGDTDDPRPHHPLWADAFNKTIIDRDPLRQDLRPNVSDSVWDASSLPFEDAVDARPRPARRGGDWNCLHWMRWSAFADPAYHVYAYAPLRWYWRLLFAPVPGLRVPEGRMTAGVPASMILLPRYTAEGCLSLAEYILRAGPKLLARQIRYNVILTNQALSARLGGTSIQAALEQSVANVAAAEEAAHTALARDPALQAAMKIGEQLARVPGPYTSAMGLAVGLGTSIAAFVADASIPKARADEDTFGDVVVSSGGQRVTPLVFRATPLDGTTPNGQQAMLGNIRGINDLLTSPPINLRDPAGLVSAGYRVKVFSSYLGTDPEPSPWSGAGPEQHAPPQVRDLFVSAAVHDNWWRTPTLRRTTISFFPTIFFLPALAFAPVSKVPLPTAPAPTAPAPTAPAPTAPAPTAPAPTAPAPTAPAPTAPAPTEPAPEDGEEETEEAAEETDPPTSAPAGGLSRTTLAVLGLGALATVAVAGAVVVALSPRPAPRPARRVPPGRSTAAARRPPDREPEDDWADDEGST